MIDCLICLEKINNKDKILIKHSGCRYILHLKCYNSYDKCLYCKISIKKQSFFIRFIQDKFKYFKQFGCIDFLINILIYLRYILNLLDNEIDQMIFLTNIYHINFIFILGLFIYILINCIIHLILKYNFSHQNTFIYSIM